MTAFADRVAAFVDEFSRLHPHWATAIGMHRHDERWPATDEPGRLARLAFAEQWTTDLEAFTAGDLTADERIDRDLLLGELAAVRFAEETLRSDAWDPLEWVYLLGFGLFPLTAREFAPLADRLGSVAGRLEGVPRVVEDARAVIGSHPTRSVSKLHATTAAQRLAGISAIAADAVNQAQEAAEGDAAVAAVLPRLLVARETADVALQAFEAHLRDVVVPSAEGEGLLGAALFDQKLVHTLRDPSARAETLLARAEREFAAVRAEMVRLADVLWPTWRPDEPKPSDEGALVRVVLDAIALDHPAADDLLGVCRRELERIETFVRERTSSVWPTTRSRSAGHPVPAQLRRGDARLARPARSRSEGLLRHHPGREEWSSDEVESYLRENNTRQLKLLTMHEAVPGHYLQFVYANRASSPLRTIFASGLFAEGWAVYVTQVMLDEGFVGDDLALRLVHSKFFCGQRRQRDPRRAHPYPQHDDRGGRALHGRGDVPGGGRGGAKDERARAVLHPAGDLLPRLPGDVGHRGRRSEAGGRRGRRQRGGRARPGGRRRLRGTRRASATASTSSRLCDTARRRSRLLHPVWAVLTTSWTLAHPSRCGHRPGRSTSGRAGRTPRRRRHCVMR